MSGAVTTTSPPSETTAANAKSVIEQLIELIQINFPALTPDEQLQLLAILLQYLPLQPDNHLRLILLNQLND